MTVIASLTARAWAGLGLAIAAVALPTMFLSRKAPAYGVKVTFTGGRPLAFPDFRLEYTGSRQVQTPQFPRGWVAHDFVATSGKERVPVSWSAGTGDIGPSEFVIAGKRFWLELVRSDSLGRLKTDQLVVTDKGAAG